MKIISWIRSSIAILLMVILSPAFAQITSYPLNSGTADPAGEGFIYALPLNIVKVDVHVTKTEKFKGMYSEFATKMLGITEVIEKDQEFYGIDRITVSTVSEIDTSHLYFAKLPEKLKDDHTFMVNLSEKGFITGYRLVNKEDDDNLHQVAVTSPFRDLLKPVLIEKVDTIIRKVSIDTNIFEEKVLKRSISVKSTEQQAREIADLIYRIEDSKYSLITGYQEVNYSKESMQFMLDQLNRMEKEYLAFFKGSTLTSEEVYTYYYTPMTNSEASFNTLFRFSTNYGILSKSGQSGDPVNITVTPLNKYAQARKFEGQRMNIKRKAKGLYYRIPESTTIDITIGNKILTTEKATISQMGILTFLPYSTLSSVEFTENGQLRTLILE